MYELNAGSAGKANELFMNSRSQPAWVACQNQGLEQQKCLVHARWSYRNSFIVNRQHYDLCNQCVEIKVLAE